MEYTTSKHWFYDMLFNSVIEDFQTKGFSVVDIPKRYFPIIQKTMQSTIDFFGLSETEKMKVSIRNQKHHRGYVPFSEQGKYSDEDIRRYEALDLLHTETAKIPFQESSVFYGPNLWPETIDMQTDIEEYIKLMIEVSQSIFKEFAIFCDLDPTYFFKHTQKPLSQLRLLHYVKNESPNDENGNNMGAHTDYECFTILLQNSYGMQYLDKEGSWKDAKNDIDQWIIFPSDLMEVMSNGKIKALMHRVINTRQDRISIPFFANLNEHYLAESFSKFGEKKYTPLKSGEHLFNNMLEDFPYLQKKFPEMDIAQLPKRFYVQYPREFKKN